MQCEIRCKLPTSAQIELRDNANRLVAPGKGILAADETPTSVQGRLATVGIPNTEEMRRQYRQLLFGGDCELGKYLSGVILCHETLYHTTDDLQPLKCLLADRGILIGIKVDKGMLPLAGSEDETVTRGLDELADRCKRYKMEGCDFAKWRSVFKIGPGLPSMQAIEANCHGLAQYAAICQSELLVPIVEPEILTDGTHDLKRAGQVTELVLTHLFRIFKLYHIYLEGMILKPAMVLPGSKCKCKYTVEDVAAATVCALKRTVPIQVPGVAFLSGGQEDELAILHLNAMNASAEFKPWRLTFCYGRTLQYPCLKAWLGRREFECLGQKALMDTARKCSKASKGKYLIPDECPGPCGCAFD